MALEGTPAPTQIRTAVVNGSEIDAGFLLPPAQTWAGVDAAAVHVASYRAAATLPFLIETGVNYLRPRPGELSDGAFIAVVADRGDCAILLDLHNLLANERNGREPVSDVLSEIPLERVLEVHVAGGFRFDGYYLDAHIGGPDGELLALLTEVLPRLPNVRAVTFEAMPESLAALGAGGVRSVLEALHRVIEGGRPHGVWRSGRDYPAGDLQARGRPGRVKAEGGIGSADATQEWERRIAAYTSRITDDPPAADPGLGLLRQLADQARARATGPGPARPDQISRRDDRPGPDRRDAAPVPPRATAPEVDGARRRAIRIMAGRGRPRLIPGERYLRGRCRLSQGKGGKSWHASRLPAGDIPAGLPRSTGKGLPIMPYDPEITRPDARRRK